MAKRNKRKTQQKEAARTAAEAAGPETSRRRFLGLMKTGAIGVAAVGGLGWLVRDQFMATAAEYDLTRIGQGTPKVVQIHDPQCPSCAALQREARAAVETFDEDEICLLVANIRTAKGSAFAASHGVGHVTLLLFDGAGRRVAVLEGRRQRDELMQRFKQIVV